MVKDSKTGDFGNCDFSRKNQNFGWKTTLTYFCLPATRIRWKCNFLKKQLLKTLFRVEIFENFIFEDLCGHLKTQRLENDDVTVVKRVWFSKSCVSIGYMWTANLNGNKNFCDFKQKRLRKDGQKRLKNDTCGRRNVSKRMSFLAFSNENGYVCL